MIEIRITKEIGNYKPKLLGPFTSRQVVCLIITVPLCCWIFTTASEYLPGDIPGFLCAIPAGIAWLFGWYEPYGMPTEKFLQSIAVNVLLAPSNRPYKIKNTHEELFKKVDELEKKESSDKKSSEKVKTSTKRSFMKVNKNEPPQYYL